MPVVDAVVACPVHSSFRVDQVAGMFDVALEEKSRASFSVEIPGEDEDWTIGAIVGPSGSGKTTIARKAFGDQLYVGSEWPESEAVVDGFGDRGIKEITSTLTAVGFSSPPSWVKPYRVLSNGERFRCDLARAMLSDRPLVAFDEFTSVVDRNVAKIGSAAVAKSIRKGHLKKRFVAVTCHYDILEWLEPDWVVDMATCELARGRLRRPNINLELIYCKRSAWELFKKHHYLSASLPTVAQSYLAIWGETPVAYCCVSGVMGKKGNKRIARIVVLPDYQGVGIAGKTMEMMGYHCKGEGFVLRITASHPAVHALCKRSPLWRCTAVKKSGSPTPKDFDSGILRKGKVNRAAIKRATRSGKASVPKSSTGRAVVSFVFTG